MLGKKLINSGPISSGANTFASENFNTVLYTGTGAAQRIGGYINRGAVFNGSAYITTGYKAASSTAASISLWVSIAAYTSYGGFAIDSTGTGAQARFTLGQGNTGGKLWVSVANGSSSWYDETTVSISSYGLNNWFHLAGTVDGTSVKIYINGSLIHTFTSSVSYVGGGQHNYYLGGWGNSLRLNGKMDQVRFFNKAISSSEVTTLYGETFASTTISTTDIFDDNSGQALYQLDGNANDTGGVSGKYGEAAIFNGTSSKIQLPNNLINNVSPQTFSVAFWFKNDNLSAYGNPFSAYAWASGVNYGWSIYAGYGNGKIRFLSYSSNGNMDFSGATNLVQGTWYHCVLTYGGGYAKLYLNGSQDASTSISGNRTYISNHTYYIGAANNGAGGTEGYFTGRIEDVRIYTDVLTATEIGYIYNNTTASIPTDNLLAYYKLNGDARDEQQLYDGAATNVTYAYDGTASNITYQEATRFTPDLVWIKRRNNTSNHEIYDSVRGEHKVLQTDNTASEYNYSTTGVTDFDSNGFTVAGTAGNHNVSGGTYVAWCFNAGSGNAGSNTDGTITSTVKANPDAGFSIVKWAGTGVNGKTIGHGLNGAPEIIITKGLSNATSWVIGIGGVSGFAVNDYLTWANSTNYAKGNSSTFYQAYSTGTFQVGVSSANEMNKSASNNYVSYCFRSIAGYQKIGTYTGNSSTSNIIETGFKPVWILIKNPNTTDGFYILDDKRKNGTFTNVLYPNLNNAEQTSTGGNGEYSVNFLENGFELTEITAGYNQSNNTYLYLAIAGDPDQTDPTVENSFDVVTYTGNDSSQDIETDFKPDLVWIKRRTSSEPHAIYDSIRGINKQLSSDSAGAEATNSSPYEGFTAFNDNGFTVGNNGGTNRAPNDYVAWCWKAKDHDENLPQINTEGSIDSIVSVNDAAGFSIVKYVGNATDNATVGTGLSSAAELVIVKDLDNTQYWVVGGSIVGNGKTLYLNDTSALLTRDRVKSVQSNTFTLGSHFESNGSNVNFIAYCWYSVTGHSKIGSYVGTGGSISAIDVGFEPRFVMIKSTGNTSGNWAILDNLREGTSKHQLSANGSHAEYDNQGVTFTSTGFSPRQSLSSDTNTSSVTYIYMAFK